MARFFGMLRHGGQAPRGRVLSAAAVAGMTTALSPADAGAGGFGYGTLVDTAEGRVFARGTRTAPGTWGHSGATAVQAWHDPRARLTLIALTDSLCAQAESDARFDRLSDAVHERFAQQ
jgi:CubicO group peptidase (beta-lactamase class C family)